MCKVVVMMTCSWHCKILVKKQFTQGPLYLICLPSNLYSVLQKGPVTRALLCKDGYSLWNEFGTRESGIGVLFFFMMSKVNG